MLEKEGDAGTAVDPHGPKSKSPRVLIDACEKANSVTRRKEERDDSVGHVRELVGEVLIGLRPVNIGAVDEKASIRAPPPPISVASARIPWRGGASALDHAVERGTAGWHE